MAEVMTALDGSTQAQTLTRARLLRFLLYIALVVGAILSIGPFLFTISISLSSASEAFSSPPRLVPTEMRVSNYVTAVDATSLLRYLLNSIIVATVTTVVTLLIDAMAGYTLAKLHFRGRGVLTVALLMTLMLPVQVTLIPLFLMFKRAPLLGGNDWMGNGGTGLLNTYPALILPLVASTLGVYLMREFFRVLPNELLQAARVDGLSEGRIFWQIYLPLAKPALGALAILTFTYAWNDFMWPLIMATGPDVQTIQVGLTTFQGHFSTDWPLLMAAVVISALPVFIVFLLGQRYFVQGIALSGIRG
jgi:multiple sugar transport system permease protein